MIGERQSELRGLAKTLVERDREVPPPRTILGKAIESLAIRDPKVKKSTHLANPKPNAPLLKRIVRHPYALEGTQSKTRVQLRQEVPWKELVHDERPHMADVLNELRVAVTNGNPVSEIVAMRDLNRPRPSADGWLGDLSSTEDV